MCLMKRPSRIAMMGDPKVCDIGIKEKKPGAEMGRFFVIAMAQMMADLWKALKNDHKEVGD